MKGKYIISFLIIGAALLGGFRTNAQPNLWDIPTTEALIAHNKTNFSDNKTVNQNQAASTVSVGFLKNTKDQCKQLMDSLDKRLNTLYIILADATLVIQIGNIMSDVYQYQSDAFQLVLKYPYAAFLYYNNQQKIIRDAESLFNLVYLVILSYGDIGKMKVSARKIVYTQILSEMGYLRSMCSALDGELEMIDFSEKYKNSHGWNFIDMDKDKVSEILNDWKH